MNNQLNDIESEKYTISVLLKFPTIFADVSNIVDENDYISKVNKIAFSSIKESVLSGEEVSPYIIANKVNNLGISFSELSGGNFLEYLEELKNIPINEKAGMSFFKKLKKMTVRREISQTADHIKDAMKGAGDAKIEDIISMADKLYSGKMSLFVKEGGQEFEKIFDSMEEMIEHRALNPITEFGFYSPFERFNYLYGPMWSPQNINLTASASNTGKAQNINCKVMTPEGWRKIGDLKVNDFVIGSDGNPKKVIGVFPQGIKKSFKVSFDDGGQTYCCDEHLWLTATYRNRANKRDKTLTVKTLKEISDTLIDKHGGRNHGVQIVKPVNFSKKDLPLHPYLLGLLLGDGGFSGSNVGFTTADQDSVDYFRKLLPDADLLSKINGESGDYEYDIVRKSNLAGGSTVGKRIVSETCKILTTLNLQGLKSSDKFIPEIYKYSCVEDRIALLQGLMDTDGNLEKTKSPTVTYNSTSKQLADGVLDIVRSLGGRGSITLREDTYYYKDGAKVPCKPLWRVWITFQAETGIIPFRLKRKADLFKFGKKKKYRYIKSIERVEDAKSVCIKIDSEDSLYVTDDYILTHNTSFGFFNSLNAIEKYNTKLLWLDAGEMSGQALITRSIVSVSKGVISTYMLQTGLWRKDPHLTQIVRQCMARLKKIKDLFFFKNIGGLSSEDTCTAIRRFWLAHIGRFSENPHFGSHLGPFFPINLDYLKGQGATENMPEHQIAGRHMENLKNLITQEVPAGIKTYLQLNQSGITRGKKASEVNDSEGAFSVSQRIFHNISNGYILRYKTNDQLAAEGQQYGNCMIKLVKKRDLGEGYKEALAPVRQPSGALEDNYIHINQDSFYWEEKGDLLNSTKEMSGEREENDSFDDDSVELK